MYFYILVDVFLVRQTDLLLSLSINNSAFLVIVWRSEISTCIFILYPILFLLLIPVFCVHTTRHLLINLPILYLRISFPQSLCLTLPFVFNAYSLQCLQAENFKEDRVVYFMCQLTLLCFLLCLIHIQVLLESLC